MTGRSGTDARQDCDGTHPLASVVRSGVQGSTNLAERHDPELIRRILARYYDVARAAFMFHGASAEQIQGDAVLAVFDGYEDDALRAARAAKPGRFAYCQTSTLLR